MEVGAEGPQRPRSHPAPETRERERSDQRARSAGVWVLSSDGQLRTEALTPLFFGFGTYIGFLSKSVLVYPRPSKQSRASAAMLGGRAAMLGGRVLVCRRWLRSSGAPQMRVSGSGLTGTTAATTADDDDGDDADAADDDAADALLTRAPSPALPPHDPKRITRLLAGASSLSQAFLSPTHPFLPYRAPHFSHISPFILVSHPPVSPICRTPLFPYLTFYSFFSLRPPTRFSQMSHPTFPTSHLFS